MKETPQISIIIPVYNVESYLCRCLDSILIQSYKDWECILVDDGSTDGSSKICDDYVEKDDRFKVIHKENGGVSSARNAGIEESSGVCSFFSDSDDYLEKDALKIMIEGLDNDYGMVMAGFNIYAVNGTLKETPKQRITKVISPENAIWELYRPSDFSYQGYLWSKLFLSQVIKDNHLRFNSQISFNEDALFIMQYVCRIKKPIYYTTLPVYNYFERANSAMGSMMTHFNPKFSTHFDSVIIQKEEVFAYTKNIKIRIAALRRIASIFKYCHEMMFKHGEYYPAIHKRMYKGLINSGAIWFYLAMCFFLPLLTWIRMMSWVLWPRLVFKKAISTE